MISEPVESEPVEDEVTAETVEQEESQPIEPTEIADDGRIMGITVHRTDKLKTDFWMAHPLVRITVVDLNTGHYLKKQNKSVELYVEIYLMGHRKKIKV